MKKIFKLPIFLVFLFILTFISHSFATGALAARLLYEPGSGILTGPTQIRVIVDTQGESVKSAVAVVTFDTYYIQITDVASGDFFTTVTSETNTDGEVVISGSLDATQTEGVAGSGTLATLTVNPLLNTSNFVLGFLCSSGGVTDSNIISIEDENLLATDEQCEQNVEGSYSIEMEEEEATVSATTKGDQPVMPEELPQAGFRSWLKWITSGLALIGIGLLLL